jgi:hypothetical protein
MMVSDKPQRQPIAHRVKKDSKTILHGAGIYSESEVDASGSPASCFDQVRKVAGTKLPGCKLTSVLGTVALVI